jgi:voltage-gated potassium channel
LNRAELEKKWDKATGIPLLVLALIFLFLYSAPIIFPDLDPQLIQTFEVLQTVIWVIFVVDFVGRFTLSPAKRTFMKQNFIEFLAVLLPILRPLRALRLLSVLTIGMRRFGGKLRNKIAIYVFATASLLWFLAGLAVTEAERGAEGANITNFGQGLWWSFITMATVGYGDKYPVTAEGQFVAVGIVLTGIALLGTISAVLAAWLIDSSNESKEANEQENELTRKSLLSLTREIKKLNKEITSLKAELNQKGIS